jgi:Tfp pilus assembly protein PilO
MNPGNRQQLLAIVAISAVALLLGDRLVLTPLVRGWEERSARITQLRRDVEQGRQLIQREQPIRSRWENMRTNTLPSQVSTAESQVLRSFDRWSQDSRISITSIKPQWKTGAEDYVTLECRVDASGTLPTLTRFLYDIEKDPLALKVDSLEITSRGDDGQQLALGLQVSGLLLNPQE